MTRFAWPHVHSYMFCPYVMCTPLLITRRIQMRRVMCQRQQTEVCGILHSLVQKLHDPKIWILGVN
jgi:hypothetical protein